MDSSELGMACVAAAREQVDSPQLWQMLVERAAEIDLDPRDTSLLLNGLSRTRKLGEFPKLFPSLWPRMEHQLDYYSSIQLAMVLSSVAKSASAGTPIPPGMVPSLVSQIKRRVHEFSTPLEISMVLNAISKLGVNDVTLFQRLSSFIQSRMALSAGFHARELSVIASAFAGAGFRDTVLFEKILERCTPTLPEATPGEFARLLAAFARVGLPLSELIDAADTICSDRFKYMSPIELRNTIFAFGSVCEVVDPNEIRVIIDKLKSAFLSSFPLFQPKDITSVLVSFSRWRIAFSEGESRLLLERLMKLRIDSENAIGISGSIGPTIHPSVSIHSLVRHWVPFILPGLNDCRDTAQAVRAIVACVELGAVTSVRGEIGEWIIKRIAQIDKPARDNLADSLGLVLPPDDDLVLLLRE
jgi:hypothetical protein